MNARYPPTPCEMCPEPATKRAPVELFTTDGPCLGPYSPATKASGLVFASGQLGMADGKLAEGIAGQTRASLHNLAAVLAAAGTTMDRVAKCTVFLKDMNDFAAMNTVYAECFGAHKPARICVEVSRLPKDALVEIDAIAAE